jgi:hypothetical protein
MSYEACELFNKSYSGVPVIDLLKHSSKPKPDIALKGQMSFSDLIGGD